MEVQRIRITLREPEYRALLRLAESELRPVDMQAVFLVKQALERTGLLSDDESNDRVALKESTCPR